jgi:hypothetical protein
VGRVGTQGKIKTEREKYMNEEEIDKYLDRLDKQYEELEIIPVDKMLKLFISGSPILVNIEKTKNKNKY